MLTGNDLRNLRRGLSLGIDSFAKYFKVNVSLMKTAEKFKKEEIPMDGKFRPLQKALVVIGPQMIVARLQQMQNVAQVLQYIGEQLKQSEKWLKLTNDNGKVIPRNPSFTEDKDGVRHTTEEDNIVEEPPGKDRRSAAE